MRPMKTQEACDVGRLKRWLANRLAPQEEAALTLHLDACSTCRERLEELTATPDEWEQLRRLSGEAGSGEASCAWVLREEDRAEDNSARNPTRMLSFLGPTDDPAMLGRLGPYEVIAVIGEGGMGIVLKVFDRALNRNVAVKVLAPQLAAAAAARRRFGREARAAAAVVHEHVIAIHAVAEFNGFPYLVMPYVAGRSLQQRIESVGPLSVAEILRIGAQTAAGLAAAHAQGLVHRDIKPANILLENGVERVLITDFGLARAVDDATLTCSGIVAGTPQYMAPEQALGGSIDHRADLFSLGSVLYTMCTGRPPFRAQTAVAVLRRICEDRPRPVRELNPDVPSWLQRIVDRLHAKDPSDRFQTAAEVADLFEKCLAHVQSPSACPLPRGLATTPVRCFLSGVHRHRARRLRWGLAALLMLSSIGLAGYWLSHTYYWTSSDSGEASGGYTESIDPAAADLGAWDVEAARLRSSAQAADDAWFDVPNDQWLEAETIPQLKARIQRLDAELSPSSF